MVRRAQLSPKLVFDLQCPKTGELWVADTKIRGFGVRLWTTASGGQKAFAIRTAIRIFFEFRAPLTRILSAEWNQIVDQYWYPYSPDEKEFWFECREQIEKDARKVLDRIRQFGALEFNKSSFWFPTRFARKHSHIRSVEHVWRVTLKKCGFQYYPLREFSRSYREFNNPSYYISFLRQYSPIFAKAQNVAEVSKSVTRARKINLTSDT